METEQLPGRSFLFCSVIYDRQENIHEMSNHAKHAAPKEKKSSVPKAVSERDSEWINETEPDNHHGAKKNSRKALTIVIVVLAVIAVLLLAAYLVFSHFYSKMNYERAVAEPSLVASSDIMGDEDEEPVDSGLNATEQEIMDMQAMIQEQLRRMGGSKMSDADIINVLLIGTDARSRTEAARSDVMMLASLNKKTQKIVLTSFMRDIYTYIPGLDSYNRLNAPYALGGSGGSGAALLIGTLEQDFGVEINNYAAVNFYDFAAIIDSVGGIDIPLTNSEVDFINDQVYGEQAYLGVGEVEWLEYTDGGTAHLNGTQALAHCRNRSSSGSDYDRTERQRTVVAAIIAKAKTLSLEELGNLLNEILPLVTTDLTQADCLSLLASSAEYLSYEVETLRIPAVDYYDTYINGMAVIGIDFSSNAQVIQDTIYGE